MLQYVDSRNTRDINLIMSPSELDQLPEIASDARDRDFARGSFEGVQVDLLLTTNALFNLVRDEYSEERGFAERPIRCATPDGLVLLKLFALPSLYRQGEGTRAAIYEADIRGLLTVGEVDTDTLLSVLESRMLKSDVGELKRVVSDIRAAMTRFE